MGSFSSTCAVTRTGIFRGEPVMLVHTRVDPDATKYPGYAAHTYHLMSGLYAHDETAKRLATLASLSSASGASLPSFREEPAPYVAVLGVYDDYGWLELPDGSRYHSGQPTHRTIRQPEYEDDGWDQRLPPEHMFFVKTRVLSQLFLGGAPVTDENKMQVLKELASFAMTTRIQLFGDTHTLLGAQWFEADEFELTERLQQVTLGELGRLRFDHLHDDDEIEPFELGPEVGA